MKNNSGLIRAIVSIVVGLLFIVKKGEIISLAMTLLGIGAIIMSIIDFVNRRNTKAIFEAIIGVFVIVFGWLVIDLAIYAIAIVLIIYGIMQIVAAAQSNCDILELLSPIATAVAGVCLLFNRGSAISLVFIIAGILLFIDGVLGLINSK